MPHYEVIPVDKYGHPIGGIEIVASRKEIPAAKARIREKTGGKARQKFDVFETDKAIKGQATPAAEACQIQDNAESQYIFCYSGQQICYERWSYRESGWKRRDTSS